MKPKTAINTNGLWSVYDSDRVEDGGSMHCVASDIHPDAVEGVWAHYAENERLRAAAPMDIKVALFGSMPVTCVTGIIDVIERYYPGSVAYSSDHEEAKRLGATMCLAVRRRS